MTDHLFVLSRIPVKIDDYVTILPSEPGARDGFVGRVKSARFAPGASVPSEVTVVGARGKRAPAWRTFVTSRVRPMRPAQQRKMQEAAARH